MEAKKNKLIESCNKNTRITLHKGKKSIYPEIEQAFSIISFFILERYRRT